MNKNKEKYLKFCEECYVPIYSQSWWLDMICLPENWDVWICEDKGDIIAAMPYYKEIRGKYRYITKAPLTQNNGIIFKYPTGISNVKKQSFEEKIINKMCEFCRSLDIDVYEQQYQYSFTNYLPFFWNNYQAIPRYTYVISSELSSEQIWEQMSTSYRNEIKKGNKNGFYSEEIELKEFYQNHEKVFLKQKKKAPFSYELWERLCNECYRRKQGKMMCFKDNLNNILSVLFLVWDEKSMYQLLGGSMPEFQKLETYKALIWKAILKSREVGLAYDFEGSMIKNISRSFRRFGGEPKLYFRIRKVFNEQILIQECNEQCNQLKIEKMM